MMGEREDSKRATQGLSKFSAALYEKLCGRDGNVFYSPFSVYVSLAMLHAGARGRTREEMAEVLNFAPDPEAIGGSLGSLVREVSAETGTCEVGAARALWAERGYRFAAGFVDRIRRSYDADLFEVTFAHGEETAERINRWVGEKTRGKIGEIADPLMFAALTKLVLTDAIHFRGLWKAPFREEATSTAPFHLESGEKVDVPMMAQEGYFGYLEEDNFQALELFYDGEVLSMLILLPRRVGEMGALERSLTAEKLSGLRSKLAPTEVEVFLPRFTMEAEFGLGETLGAMGVRRAFVRGEADFSGIADREDLYVSGAFHKAIVTVDEKGTEAAAATMVVGALALPEPVPVFRADRPFMFLIRNARLGTPLFMGRLARPEAAAEGAVFEREPRHDGR
jgi:serpin B